MEKEIIQSYIDERELLYKDIYTFEDGTNAKMKRLQEIDGILKSYIETTS